jgi:hypothetical protein
MICGKCSQSHDTVAEVKSCYGITTSLKPEPDRGREGKESWIGPTDKQWDAYRSLADQLGRHVHNQDRDLFSMEKISDLIGEMLVEVRTKPPKQVASSSLPSIPEGRYAIPSLTGNNDLDFFRVDCPTEGKWKGYLFVNRVIGGKPDVPVRAGEKAKVLKAIDAYGITESRVLFGTNLGICWRCGRHLTDKLSRQLGIGPDCRSRES